MFYRLNYLDLLIVDAGGFEKILSYALDNWGAF